MEVVVWGVNWYLSHHLIVNACYKTGARATLKTTYTFTKPGTYFPILRVTSQREGDTKTPYTCIQNLDRVRVVVQ
ncbi:MAG TPA: hypothetical protein VF700_00470 [Segetibacter sp.]